MGAVLASAGAHHSEQHRQASRAAPMSAGSAATAHPIGTSRCRSASLACSKGACRATMSPEPGRARQGIRHAHAGRQHAAPAICRVSIPNHERTHLFQSHQHEAMLCRRPGVVVTLLLWWRPRSWRRWCWRALSAVASSMLHDGPTAGANTRQRRCY